MSFSRFNLTKTMLKAIDGLNFTNPSPIQNDVIPKILQKKDVIVQAETGSGKTHSFLIPIINNLDTNLARLQVVIISPTRELARQSFEFAKYFVRYYPHLKIRLFTSEDDTSCNLKGASIPPHILFGTPGRLSDMLVERHLFNLNNVRQIVLDEADMLLELNYFEDIQKILDLLNKPQILIFSATLKQNLKDELVKICPMCEELLSTNNFSTNKNVSHHLVNIKHIGVNQALLDFLKIRKPYLAMIFASKKETVSSVYQFLKANNYEAIYFTGDLSSRERKKALRQIKENKISLICCSDLLSRGIDIDSVSDVISIDLPSEIEYYFHRAGRCGRFNAKGDSWVFYNSDNESQPKLLIELGVNFTFYELNKGQLNLDPVGLNKKTKLTKKKRFSDDELKDIKIAKALSRPKHIEPMYKKKQQFAIEKVKRKYKRKAIQKNVQKSINKKYQKKDFV